jgi:hypothetical protein
MVRDNVGLLIVCHYEQVAKYGKVHCDMKPPNILALPPENILEENMCNQVARAITV